MYIYIHVYSKIVSEKTRLKMVTRIEAGSERIFANLFFDDLLEKRTRIFSIPIPVTSTSLIFSKTDYSTHYPRVVAQSDHIASQLATHAATHAATHTATHTATHNAM